MRKLLFALCVLCGIFANAQTDTSILSLMNDTGSGPDLKPVVKIFNSQKLINANTVEMLRKGHMEFKVLHNFGDVAGKDGGIKNFFGMDGAEDIKISFQVALSDKFNVVAARVRGGQRSEGGLRYENEVRQLWELGLKYGVMQQREKDPSHPLAITLYGNMVFSGMKIDTFQARQKQENSFNNFHDRGSWILQLMIARKMGPVSLQFNPTFLHTNLVLQGDDDNLFALAGAARVQINKNFALIADYFHPLRSDEGKQTLRSRNIVTYDAFGIGFELLTPGHVFHFNATNSTHLLENRFIPRTVTTWGKGQYRWGFTIARDFVIFRPKKK